MKRIVVADDSQTARMFVKRCLQIVGLQDVEFCEAGNGKEALALLKEQPTDLLVTDLNMPTMDGETLLKWVKGNPRLTDVPVMVVTSAGNPAKEEQLVKLGAFCVLNKPVNPALLREKLQPLLKEISDA
ncbi:response regulator [Geothermobacter hydrogeniphilus]|uniref:Response regulator n=1 Tax=Geothermobacter hydrogeniphilus TaxID=1969733 RepID=A0A1X0YEI6_9BACT|nr:response regulator [Geothermobacter hydrogeniphilus]ORJ63537.1 response regulator [Geothermobacter hydrogeniphilus]PNU21105.1 response regulator [Geothermobacter hydrogeniphilus]